MASYSNQDAAAFRTWFESNAKTALMTYLDKLINDGYDSLECFAEMSSEDLMGLDGMKKGHCKQLLKLVEKAKMELGEEGEEGKERDAPGELSFVRPTWAPGTHVVPHKIVVSDREQAMRENHTLEESQFINLKGPDAIAVDETKLLAILVVGQTGAGKTTLINSMVNVLYGVQLADAFRLKLIVEPPTEERKTQASSQTNQVFGYYLEDPPLLGGKSLLIIDTPGFGDSRGFAQDEHIMASIKEFFENKIDFLNAVCFVCKAPDARVGPLNKYIFDKVLGLFGTDIADIIMLLFTFADGKTPPALAAIEAENVQFAKWFPLNNSAFFRGEEEAQDMFTSVFWKLGVQSIRHFLSAVENSRARSLDSCRQVLRRREQLQTSITSMRDLVALGLSKLDELEQTVQVMQSNAAEMKATEDFEFQVSQTRYETRPKPAGTYNTVCNTCKWTCHKNCAIPNDSDKSGCCAMNSHGFCTSCPHSCVWHNHQNLSYYWVAVPYMVTKTKDDLKKRYCQAKSKKSVHDQIMQGLNDEFEQVQLDVYKLVHNIKEAVNELNEMALRPGLMHDDQYFDLMIEQERQEHKWGWQKRVEELKKIKERSRYLSQVASTEGWNPFEARHREIANQARPLQESASSGISAMASGVKRALQWAFN